MRQVSWILNFCYKSCYESIDSLVFYFVGQLKKTKTIPHEYLMNPQYFICFQSGVVCGTSTCQGQQGCDDDTQSCSVKGKCKRCSKWCASIRNYSAKNFESVREIDRLVPYGCASFILTRQSVKIGFCYKIKRNINVIRLVRIKIFCFLEN